MNKTTNYNLNQWEAGDRVLRTDFNSDNAKIDAALAGLEASKAEKTALAAIQTKVDGALQYATGSYVGTDTFGSAAPNSLTFPFKPLLVFLACDTENSIATLIAGTSKGTAREDTLIFKWNLTWSGNTLSWWAYEGQHSIGSTYTLNAKCQMNEDGLLYRYAAIGIKNS